MTPRRRCRLDPEGKGVAWTRQWTIPLLTTACLLLSCSEVLGPTIELGGYSLTALDGAPAPFVLSDGTFADGERIVVEQVQDSIRFESSSRLIRGWYIRTWFYRQNGSVDTVFAGMASTGSYTKVGSGLPHKLIITLDAVGTPVPPETLEVVSNVVIIRRRLVGGWCKLGPPQECPTTPRVREFAYHLK
jgi:hypothetical protein